MVTFEDIQEALKDESMKGKVITALTPDVQKALETSGMIIRSKEQDEAYVNAKVEPLVEVKIKDQIKSVHEKYDQDLLELTGDRKKPEEKTYDFLKRKIAEIKASKGGDDVDKDKLKSLQDSLEKMKKDHETEISTIHSGYLKNEVGMNVHVAVSGFNIAVPANLTDDQKADFIARQRKMIASDFQSAFTAKKDNEGNIVFYKGEQLQISTKDGKPLTAEQLIAENYQTYFAAPGRKQGGAGSGGDYVKELSVTSTKQDILSWLKANNYQENTKDFLDKYEELQKKYGIIK